jgi:hypothetical protein
VGPKSDFFTHQSSFFGREPDIDFLCGRVAHSGVTFLTARPKMGKSWLLLAVAQKLAERDPARKSPDYLVGYHECTGGEEFLRYALQDLYTRWLQRASDFEQAKKAWDQKKGTWLPTVARVFGSIFGGALPGGIGDTVKSAIDGLVSANDMLKSGGLELPQLAYEQGRDLANSQAEISGCRLVLIFDAWEKAGSLDHEKWFLEHYINHRDEWPEIHFIVALRYPNITGNSDDSAWQAAQDLKSFSAKVDVYELPTLHLDVPAESARLTSYLRECLPKASAVPDGQLLDMLQAYPGTLERWVDSSDLATADQLQRAANDAAAFLYRELDGMLSALDKGQDKGQVTLALRLALLPRLSAETWPLFKPLVEEGLQPDGWIDICGNGLLTGNLFPTFGHDTRHQAAASWFLKRSGARISKEASRFVTELGRRMLPITPPTRYFSAAITVVARTANPQNLTPLAQAVALANLGCGGQNPGASLLFSALWLGSKENVVELSPMLAMGLFNTIIDAQGAKDLPLAMGLLGELRRLRDSFPDEPMARLRFAMILVNLIVFTRELTQADLSQQLTGELRALSQKYPSDAAVRRELALALRNAIQAAAVSSAFDQIDPLNGELRGLLAVGPDAEIARYQVDSLFFGLSYGVRAGRSFEQVRPWLDEMKFLSASSADPAVSYRYGEALSSVGLQALNEKEAGRFLAFVTQIQQVQLRFPSNAAIAILAARMMCDTIGNTPWSDVLPTLRPYLEHLQKLCAAFPAEENIRKPARDLKSFLEQSCNGAPTEMDPLKAPFLAELATFAL